MFKAIWNGVKGSWNAIVYIVTNPMVAVMWLVLVAGLVAVLVVGAFKIGGYNLNIETEAQTHERVMNASLEAEADYYAQLQRNLDYLNN